MEPPKYENIGNIRKDYKHEQRFVYPAGLLTSPNLVLKIYEMLVQGEEGNWDQMCDAKRFLSEEIEKGKIEPYAGLGFAILSRDMLNVARWDTEFPIVLKNQLYGYTPSSVEDLILLGQRDVFDSAELLDVNKSGSFCIWELGIVNHENYAWRRYLQSRKADSDKKRYLDDTIEGRL